MDSVAIFRHQMFKVSEPFIAQQAEQLTRYMPVYIGRSRFGSTPVGALSYALDDLPNQKKITRRLWQVASRDPSPYLQLLGGRRPALIHAHFGVEGVYALPLARKLGVPLVTTFHGFDATTGVGALIRSGSPSWINYALHRQELARQGELFLCVSDFIRDRVVQLGFPENRTHVHYIGIDTQSIRSRHPDEERSFILHVARLVEKKGSEFLIRAFSRMASDVPGFYLVIIGEGVLRIKLELLARELCISDRIHFMGAQPHDVVMAKMRQACFLVLPSVTASTGDAEGLGMVLLEAAALGLPLIGTRHGGIPEAVIDGGTGYLVAERDVDMLAKRMHMLISDRAMRFSMGAAARAHVETHFDVRVQTEKLEAFYRSLIE
jgi:colanic acid/amylovoran biosynthesis glycosyltransferase